LGKEKERDLSVLCIGPAGENLVRFAGIFADKGHSASQNGSGAVMGSKKLKAIAVARGKGPVPVDNRQALSAAAKRMFEAAKEQAKGYTYKYGTFWLFEAARAAGQLPVKNWTSNVFPHLPEFDPEWLRSRFEVEYRPCWACRMRHCHRSKITEGPYAGLIVEEPEYAALATWGPNMGNTDVGTTYMLNDTVDRLGMEGGQSSYIISLLMECFEKGILTREDTDGIEMAWGNAEAARAMLRKIANRDGFGDVLADGVMKAAQRIGGEAPNMAVHTMKGTTTAGSDLRYSWFRMLDACITNAGTKQSPDSREVREAVAELGIPPITDSFSWEQVATFSAKTCGRVQFTDSLGVCKWNTAGLESTIDAVKACTGWDLTLPEAMEVGRRAANLLRAFDIRHGLIPEMEALSPRMGSAPADGPAKGKSIMPVIREMRRKYYEEMGWDKETSKPLPETLRNLDLEHVIADIW
ncbi:MAG: aldehyde ferredoxin oxidoreductase C-terminal domain-containing protein, partial [Chloroflexota bacterium]|nr:aldehyde ferredoxin oxidoreductase C-terminal domain-containing protein [Chloroflexota bacterium]